MNRISNSTISPAKEVRADSFVNHSFPFRLRRLCVPGTLTKFLKILGKGCLPPYHSLAIVSPLLFSAVLLPNNMKKSKLPGYYYTQEKSLSEIQLQKDMCTNSDDSQAKSKCCGGFAKIVNKWIFGNYR